MKLFNKLFMSILIFVVTGSLARAQFVDGTRGLLCMPSAEFDEDAMFKITNCFVHEKYLPDHSYYAWDKNNSFVYSFSITFWRRLEIAYTCTLIDSYVAPGGFTFRMRNQDRHFAARAQLLKEGDFNQKWLPNIAIGTSDPLTYSAGNDYLDDNVTSSGNGFFNRYYVTLSKNFCTAIGFVGGYLGYQYSRRMDGMPTGIQTAVTWEPIWLNNSEWFMNDFKTILEYDASKINFGLSISIWNNHFEIMSMLYGMKYPMFGARYKLVLKH